MKTKFATWSFLSFFMISSSAHAISPMEARVLVHRIVIQCAAERVGIEPLQVDLSQNIGRFSNHVMQITNDCVNPAIAAAGHRTIDLNLITETRFNGASVAAYINELATIVTKR